MWYGLKRNNVLIAVKYFDHYPRNTEFDVLLESGRYTICVVRVREVRNTL